MAIRSTIEPGSFAIVKSHQVLPDLANWLPESVLQRLAKGGLIAEFRLDEMDTDLQQLYCAGKNDEALLPSELSHYAKLVRDNIINRECLSGDNEDEVIWVCYDPTINGHYLVPEKAIAMSTTTPKEVYESAGLGKEVDLGEADYLFPITHWRWVNARQPYS